MLDYRRADCHEQPEMIADTLGDDAAPNVLEPIVRRVLTHRRHVGQRQGFTGVGEVHRTDGEVLASRYNPRFSWRHVLKQVRLARQTGGCVPVPDVSPEPDVHNHAFKLAYVSIGKATGVILGDEHALLPSSLTPPGVDYVALGHIHRHQVLSKAPPVVYAGSLERVDFGEEGHEKGFCVVEIDPSQPTGERASYQFHPLPGRAFITIRVEIEAAESDPTAKILQAIEGHGEALEGAIVRLQISLPAELATEIEDDAIRAALKPAQHHTISREVQRQARARLGTVAAEEITPLEALKHYLDSKGNVSTEWQATLIEAAEELIQERGG